MEPYVGPRPFDAGDRAIFFGRNREISEIASLVLAHPVVLIYGGCGTGKTSLVNAGVLPSLRDNGFQDTRPARVFGPMPVDFTVDEVWGIKNLYLFNAMTSLAGADQHAPRHFLDLSLQEFIQDYVLQERNRDDGRPRQDRRRHPEHALLLFDQLEELFTCYSPRWKEREDFFRQIADAIRVTNEYHSLRVVFVMREDFLSQLEAFAYLLPEELQTRYRLEGLCESSAIDAIKGPVESVAAGVSFESGAAEELVKRLRTFQAACAAGVLREVESECVEPMHLQLVCQKLWCRARGHWEEHPVDKNRITIELVTKHADVDAALQEFYNDAVRQSAMDAHLAEWRLREWCGKLITPHDTRAMLHRGEHHAEGVPNEAADELGARHLVRTEERFGGLWYELSHDRFIEPVKKSNAAFEISSRRKNLEETALSVIVLALTDLRLAEASVDEAGATPGRESAPGERANRLAVDPVRTLEHPEVRFFLANLLGSDARGEEKYRKLIRLFELQDRLSKKIWEHEGPEEDTPDAMQKMVVAIAQHEGIWKPEELKTRTLDSIRCGVEYIRRAQRDDRGWGGSRDPDSRLWAAGHALLALCAARYIPEVSPSMTQMVDEGVGWVLGDRREWFVERFPPPEERSVYEVGLGLICLHESLLVAEGRRETAAPLIAATLHGLRSAQNEDGGWDAKIWKDGHADTTRVYSDVGAASWAVQSLTRWNGDQLLNGGAPLDFEAAVRKGIAWLLKTQNEDGSWSDGSCQPGTGLRLHGNPSITKTCDAIRGILCARKIGIESDYKAAVKKAVTWLRRQERRLPAEKGESAVGWAWEDNASRDTHSITTCMTLETLVQVDEVSLPLFTANAQWLMDSQDRVPGSQTHGAWPHGDSFRSTLSLIEYYKKIQASPFFAVIQGEAESGPKTGTGSELL